MNAYITRKSATEIAELLNAAGYTYRGHKPKAWEGRACGRIYFGRDFLTVRWGEVSAFVNGHFSARAIGEEAVNAAARVIENAKSKEPKEDTGCTLYEKDFISFSDLGSDDVEFIAER